MSDKICLRPGCGRAAKTRGLCATCYAAARTLIKEGKLDPAKLEEQGKILPAKAWHGNTPGPARLWFLGIPAETPLNSVIEADLLPAPKPRTRKKPESDELRNLAPAKGIERPVGPAPPNIHTPETKPRIETSGSITVTPAGQTDVAPTGQPSLILAADMNCDDCGKSLVGIQYARTQTGHGICVPCYQIRASKAAEERLAQQAINGPG